MKNKFSITTKTGDRGTTRLFSGEEVSKYSERLEAYGDLDELVSLLSVARHQMKNKELIDDVLYLQRTLFVVGSELATTAGKISKLKSRIDENFLKTMENRRSALEDRVKIPDGFVIPGNNPASAALDVCRAVSRRLERKIVELFQKKELNNQNLLIWLNRLSDYLYLMARFEEGKPQLVKEPN